MVARGMCSAPSFPRSPAPSPPELLHPPQNCSVAVCLRVQCDIASFGSQEEFGVTLTGNLSFDWYIKVCGARGPAGLDTMLPGPGPALPVSPQTPHNHLQVVSTAEILFDGLRFALPSGQEAIVRAQVSVWGTEGLLGGGGEAGGWGPLGKEREIEGGGEEGE